MRQWFPLRCEVCRVALDIQTFEDAIAPRLICRRCFHKRPPEPPAPKEGAACPLGG